MTIIILWYVVLKFYRQGDWQSEPGAWDMCHDQERKETRVEIRFLSIDPTVPCCMLGLEASDGKIHDCCCSYSYRCYLPHRNTSPLPRKKNNNDRSTANSVCKPADLRLCIIYSIVPCSHLSWAEPTINSSLHTLIYFLFILLIHFEGLRRAAPTPAWRYLLLQVQSGQKRRPWN